MRSLERRVLRLHNIREAYASAHLLSNMQVLMLEHLGEIDAASRLMKAIEDVCAAGMIMPDVGGKATTREVTDAVIAAIRGSNTSPIGNTASNRL
nr:isocitrate/isopropylmalate family dehydrogenase [Mesorhizobium sp.]